MSLYFKTYRPPQDLSYYVKNFWHFSTDRNDELFTHCSNASVFPKITFNCAGNFFKITENGLKEKLYGSGVNAQTNSHCLLGSGDKKIEVFGIFLYPHGLNAISGIPANILANNNLDIGEIWGATGKVLEEKIISAKKCEDRIDIACDFLRQNLSKFEVGFQQEIVPVVSDLLSGDYKSSADLASNHYFSLRQFQRKFKQLTGFPPKHFERISRFERACALTLHKNISLSDISHRLGYADQSHFHHDFLQFSGHSPSAYRKIAGGDTIFLDE